MNRLFCFGTTLCVAGAACASAFQARDGKIADPVATANQLVLVTTPAWNATTGTLRRFVRETLRDDWRPVGNPVQVVVGRTGLAWSDSSLARTPVEPLKHEGDGRSPAGAFPLDTAFGFAPRAQATWLRLPYAELQPGSDCVDDEKSAHYNTIVDRSNVRVDWNSAEHMRQIPVYRIGVIVGYNASPPQRGRGSCIFLHIWNGPSSVTAGCTALDATELETLMRWLDARRRPVIVQLPASELERLRKPWALPPI